MAAKPIHRRREMISADEIKPQRWRMWILPTLLFVQSAFVGSAFGTFSFTMMIYSSAAILVAATVHFMGGYDALTRELVLPSNRNSHQQNDRSSKTTAPRQLSKSEAMHQRRTRLRVIRKFVAPILILLMTALGVLPRIDSHMAGSMNFVALFVDSLAHGTLFVSIVLWVLFPYQGHPAMLACGLIAVLMAISGGGVSHTINGQLVAALTTLVGYVIGADHILGRWQLYKAIRRRHKLFTRRLKSREQRFVGGLNAKAKDPLPNSSVSLKAADTRGPLLFYVLAFSLLLMSTTAAGHFANQMVPGLRVDLLDRLSDSLEKVAGGTMIGSSRYVRGSRLGQIRKHMMGDPKEVALRAYADDEPGYLRGTIFDTYRGGAWTPVSERLMRNTRVDADQILARFVDPEAPAETPLRTGKDLKERNRFSVRKVSEDDVIGTIEIHNVPLKGQFVFTSLATEWIEASVYGVRLTHHDSVTQGVDTQTPYVLGVGANTPQETLIPIRRDIMLDVPKSIRPLMTRMANNICDGHLTARAKAKAIEQYFQANFEYSLNRHASPRDMDPVAHFLTTSHPAHCEYFASAAALLLRAAGVPTRYVTGYVLSELSDDSAYYLARNRDAHAWVEAYDDITERWFPVEATVGRRYRTFHDNVTADDTANTSSDNYLNEDDDRSPLAALLGWILSFRTSDSLTFVFQAAQLPLFSLVVLMLWLRHRRRISAFGDPLEYESRQMLTRVDRKIRKYALVRAPGETLHQFATRVEEAATQSPETPLLRQAADWYRQFASDRYQGRRPEPLGI
ncbi:transglutaminase-like domain-containing protein [Rhodopirellula sp. MGV]|uniref:transglutaminase-like domain-containing protein n=1 Tax=Rhodopirellula sp. MGV TaxID=2023130 RepID=UPI000B96268E|nr:transglutaminase-like domain-containing protein [Rhodopirellula sp. MGV]OYP35449.1 hypothetical protein CGZ80_11445 [Rhodopirellula sp. MGV]PNY33889.1 transglutaminase domain-containing protein [Rhodopirellula baltica]